jgi:hypothetical protein
MVVRPLALGRSPQSKQFLLLLLHPKDERRHGAPQIRFG